MPGPSADHATAEAWRREQRTILIGRRTALSEAAFLELSKAVVEQVDKALAGLWSRRIGLYWPRRREVGLFPLIRRVLDAGGVPALRAPSTPDGAMRFRAWTPGDPLCPGGPGLSYPRDGALVSPEVVLVPLVGFDREGFRLGYGGGSYGRMFARTPRPCAIGVGFELMRLGSVRPLPEETRLDLIVTEAGAFRREGPPVPA